MGDADKEAERRRQKTESSGVPIGQKSGVEVMQETVTARK